MGMMASWFALLGFLTVRYERRRCQATSNSFTPFGRVSPGPPQTQRAPPTYPMKVLVVEDQSMFNELLSKACRTHFSAACVVVSAFTASAAKALLQQGGYTLMLLDIQLPDMNGFDFAVEAIQIEPLLKIVGVTAYCSCYAIYRLSRSPLQAFIDKSIDTLDELWRAFQAIDAGENYYSPPVAALRNEPNTSPTSFKKLLSDREITILCRVGSGQTDEQIGEILGISSATVKWHRKQLMHKLELCNHTELVFYAYKKGFSVL